MKRPGPLPPSRPAAPDDTDDIDVEPGPPPRARASVLPFARRRRHAGQGEGDDTPRDADHGAEPGGRFAVWRAARGRRRAERAEVRRFTARARRRRIVWLSSIGAVVLLAIGTVGAAYSPLFAVERIRVVGTSTLDEGAIAEALDDQMNRPLPLVDRDRIRAVLRSFPRIETYSVESRPPHELIVRIEERTAVAAISTDAGYTAVDAAGVALDTTPEPPEGLPLAEVDEGPHSAAFAAAGQVLRSLPSDLAERITVVRASSAQDVAFDLPDGGGVTVVWGSAEDTADKVATLTAAFESTPPDTASSYDVSSAGVLVVE